MEANKSKNIFGIDLTGISNHTHRFWNLNQFFLPSVDEICTDCHKVNPYDSRLEYTIRLRIANLLTIEHDNISRLFLKFVGLQLTIPRVNLEFAGTKDDAESEAKRERQRFIVIIKTFLKHRMTLGVGINLPEFSDQINNYLKTIFFIPVLAYGKLFRLLMTRLMANDFTSITAEEWFSRQVTPLRCLLCTDFPFGLYPCNFIVNQMILYMKMFIWTDKNRLHIPKKEKNIISYRDSKRVSWFFLWNEMHSLRNQKTINHLGNMAIFSAGEIFSTFIHLMINRIRQDEKQNNIINKIKAFHKMGDVNIISIEDLVLMYKLCRRPKKYEISVGVQGEVAETEEKKAEENNIEEKNVEEKNVEEKNVEEKNVEEKNAEAKLTQKRYHIHLKSASSQMFKKKRKKQKKINQK